MLALFNAYIRPCYTDSVDVNVVVAVCACVRVCVCVWGGDANECIGSKPSFRVRSKRALHIPFTNFALLD